MATRIIVLAALMIASFAAIAAAHEGAARVERARAGPYDLEVWFYDARPNVSRPVRVSVRARGDGAASASFTIRGIPGPETEAVATRPTTLQPDPLEPGAYSGAVLLSVRGAWELEVSVTGPLGAGMSRIPVAVTAPYAIPEWIGWIVGISPLAGLAWFAWWQRHYLRTLMNTPTP